MYEAVTSRFADMDILVMAAAVADYRPATVADDKIKKKDGDLSIPVERTADILGTIGPQKTKQFLCGFSMETRDMVENSAAKLKKEESGHGGGEQPQGLRRRVRRGHQRGHVHHPRTAPGSCP